MSRKVVINACHGGFGLSREATDRYCAEKNINPGKWMSFGYYSKFYAGQLLRDDPLLIKIVEEMGEEADGSMSKLKIVEIPDDIEWSIHEYDGSEWVAEAHRTWS